MIDKNQAVIDFLLQCPTIQNSPVFFNFINAKDENKQIITMGNEKSVNTRYVDGSVAKRYTFTLVDFRSMSYNPIVKQAGYTDENVSELLDVQGIIDWIEEQATNRNFPNFGSECVMDSMMVLTDNPNINGLVTSIQPILAKYAFTIQIDYTDESKRIWTD